MRSDTTLTRKTPTLFPPLTAAVALSATAGLGSLAGAPTLPVAESIDGDVTATEAENDR
jgi:hypothetical protein